MTKIIIKCASEPLLDAEHPATGVLVPRRSTDCIAVRLDTAAVDEQSAGHITKARQRAEDALLDVTLGPAYEAVVECLSRATDRHTSRY